MVLFVLLVCGLAAVPLYLRVSRRRPVVERTELARGRAAALVAELHRLRDQVRRDIELVRADHAHEEVAALLEPAERAIGRADGAELRYAELAAAPAAPVRTGRLVFTAQAWERLVIELEKAVPGLRAQEARLGGVVARLAALPERVREVEALLERAEADRREDAGFRTDGEARDLAAAAERLHEVRGFVGERRPLAAVTALDPLAEGLELTRRALARLSERHERLARRAAGLDRDRDDLADRVAEARSGVARVARAHPASAEVRARRALERGLRAVERFDRHREEVGGALAARDVHAGERALARAEEALAQALDALAEPTHLVARLRVLSRSLPRERDALVERCRAVAARLERHPSLSALAELPREAGRRLRGLDVHGECPEWLVYEERLSESSALVDLAERTADRTADRTPGRRWDGA
ncbi:hypothetical protein [Nocardiopsis protaetiae]|uniref:hypothetical protein n=1 Tax=Nocardiopsis protaetiae TaxID=3382270 RepID=UPI00387B2722